MDDAEKNDPPTAKPEDEVSVSRWLKHSWFSILLDITRYLVIWFLSIKFNTIVRFGVVFWFIAQSENVNLCLSLDC